MQIFKIKTLEVQILFKTLLQTLSSFTNVIIFFTLSLSVVELISMSMVMPLISLGLENDNSSNLEFVKNIFSSFGINYSFNTIFISFIIIYFLKIIVVLIVGIYVDNAYYISTDLRRLLKV